MYNLPSEQKKRVEKAIKEFKETGKFSIYEPCDCGSQVRHNNGGNYHEEIYLQMDEGQAYIKRTSTSEFEPPAEWELCEDWEQVIKNNSDWL